MSSIAAHVAAAEVMTSAGNFAAARYHVGKALELDPRSRAAHRAGFEIELRGGTPRDCLAFAAKWLEIDPDSLEAHGSHFVALCRCRNRREADRKLEAIIERFGDAPREVAELKLQHAWRFGSSEAMVRDVAALREKFGNDSWLDRIDLAARFSAGRNSSALEAALRVLAGSPEEASAHLILAIVAFRRGRFAEARRHASSFIRMKPAAAVVGREIILASRLVWFPPFLFAHLIMQVERRGWELIARPGYGWRLLGAMIVAPLAGVLFALVTVMVTMASELLPVLAFKVLFGVYLEGFLMWLLYEFILFPNVGAWLRGKRRPLRLEPGY